MVSTETQFFKLTSLLFDAAPGKTYYDLYYPQVASQGIDAVATAFGSSPLLQSTLGTTSDEQARNLVSRAGLNPDNLTSGSADKAAYDLFKNALDSGMNPGLLAMVAIRYLEQSALPSSFQEAANYLDNRAAAAKAVTLDLEYAETDLEQLSDVIAQVNADPASVTQATANAFDALKASSVLSSYTDSDDTITGSDGADRIDGGAGFDTIDGGAGADILLGGSGDDTIRGGMGQDLIEGGTGADTLYAGSYSSREYVPGGYNSAGEYVSGYYRYSVDAHYEIIRGEGGNDNIYGGFGSDYLSGGDGADVIYGEEDSLYLSSYSRIDSGLLARMYNDTILGEGGNDQLYGGKGDDRLEGGDGSDRVWGGDGNDTLLGGAGNDLLYGDDGADQISGGDGDDRLYAAEIYETDDYDDVLEGGAGDDTLYGLSGNDSADGGDGDDVIYYYRSDTGGLSALIAGEGADRVSIQNRYGDRVTDRIIVDLTESVQMEDEVEVDIHDRTSSLIEVKGFDLDSDIIDINLSMDVFARDGYQYTYAMQRFDYQGNLIRNYVQIVDSPDTPWSTADDTSTGPDSYGKAFFVIQGATASSAQVSDVANLLDAYGNNAQYGESDEHLFLVNVEGVGIGVYKFEDDTGADNRIVSDELTPVVALVGLSTEQISYSNADFIV